MRLLGIEFENYACFERAFVPLDAGIQLLAGKNNSGKTALLRGLSTLTALPFEGWKPFAAEVARYSKSQKPHPSHYMRIHFRYEGKDRALIERNVEQWREFEDSIDRRWVFEFKVLPQNSCILLLGAELQFDHNKIPVLEASGANLTKLIYDERGKTQLRKGIGPIGYGAQLPEGNAAPIFSPDGLLSEFPALMKARIVHAHRVVRPNLGLQALDTLNESADSLGPFLDTVLSNDRETFDRIQSVVTNIFPEFRFVNPEKAQNSVSITLTSKRTNEKVPLTHCGTGVEQVLALATFVLTAGPGTIILLDEPHSYLHPTAERQVTDFLFSHSELRYVIATHSAILINSVTPDRILVLGGSDVITESSTRSDSLPSLIHSLGYKNSDLLFSDRLIFVEGESDQEILPLLLSRNPKISVADLERTGIPVMNGEGKLRGRDQQRSLLYWEKFLIQLGKNKMPRVYLFDGGCVQDDRKLLEKSQVFEPGNPGLLRFLTMHEIENYLLVPDAIFSALKELAEFEREPIEDLALERVTSVLQDVMSKRDNQKLYPNGSGENPIQNVKGSVVLDMFFSQFRIRYDKRRVGRLIATKITEKNQPLLEEIWKLFPRDFLPCI